MTYILILPYNDLFIPFNKNYIYVAVDSGFNYINNKEIKLDYLLGDFDSLGDIYKDINVKKIILPKEKDDTDTEYAINYFGNNNEFIIYGGIKGKRIEHLLANINLCLKYDNITIIDNNSYITKIKDKMNFNLDYKYISFFAKKGSKLSLFNYKYNLDNYIFKDNDNLCISNELINDNNYLEFKGKGIVIRTKEDNYL